MDTPNLFDSDTASLDWLTVADPDLIPAALPGVLQARRAAQQRHGAVTVALSAARGEFARLAGSDDPLTAVDAAGRLHGLEKVAAALPPIPAVHPDLHLAVRGAVIARLTGMTSLSPGAPPVYAGEVVHYLRQDRADERAGLPPVATDADTAALAEFERVVAAVERYFADISAAVEATTPGRGAISHVISACSSLLGRAADLEGDVQRMRSLVAGADAARPGRVCPVHGPVFGLPDVPAGTGWSLEGAVR